MLLPEETGWAHGAPVLSRRAGTRALVALGGSSPAAVGFVLGCAAASGLHGRDRLGSRLSLFLSHCWAVWLARAGLARLWPRLGSGYWSTIGFLWLWAVWLAGLRDRLGCGLGSARGSASLSTWLCGLPAGVQDRSACCSRPVPRGFGFGSALLGAGLAGVAAGAFLGGTGLASCSLLLARCRCCAPGARRTSLALELVCGCSGPGPAQLLGRASRALAWGLLAGGPPLGAGRSAPPEGGPLAFPAAHSLPALGRPGRFGPAWPLRAAFSFGRVVGSGCPFGA